jgi:hypothetical protein
MHDDPVNIIGILVKFFKTQFVLHKQQNQNAAGHSDSQPGNIDKGKSFMPLDVPECDFDIIFQHDESPDDMGSDDPDAQFDDFGAEPYSCPKKAGLFNQISVGLLQIACPLAIIIPFHFSFSN